MHARVYPLFSIFAKYIITVKLTKQKTTNKRLWKKSKEHWLCAALQLHFA